MTERPPTIRKNRSRTARGATDGSPTPARGIDAYASLVTELRKQRAMLAMHVHASAGTRRGIHDGVLFEYGPTPSFVVDANGVVLRANASATALLGLQPGRIRQNPFLLFVAPDDRRCWLEHLRLCRQTAGIVSTEMALQTRNDIEVPVEVSGRACATPGDSQQWFVMTVVDLREQRRLTTERTRTLEQLANAQEQRDLARSANDAKDRFLGMLSHELRTPLTPVLLATRALQDDATLPQTVRDALAMIHRSVTLQRRLIDDLLDLTRMAQGKLALEVVGMDLHAVVQEVLRFLQPEIDAARLAIALDLRATQQVAADPVRLEQIVWNLVRNAIRFTQPGGHVTIATQDEPASTVELVVTDTGVGFEPETRERLFEAFVQSGDGPRRGGLGLGLAIVAGIVRAHGGTVEAWSDGSGRGARFTVTLPAADANTAVAPALPKTTAPTTRRDALTVLLVEDHADTATALALVLEQEGYRVELATSVADALTRAERVPPDVVVSDLGLPDGSGLDLMRTLRVLRPVRGIALTGWGRPHDVAATRDAGFERHLTKPVDVPDLVAAIESVRPPGE